MELGFQRAKRGYDTGHSGSGYESSRDVQILTAEVQSKAEVEKERTTKRGHAYSFYVCCSFIYFLAMLMGS